MDSPIAFANFSRVAVFNSLSDFSIWDNAAWVKNSFIDQFSENIKFDYTSFDRVIICGYILRLFSSACVVLFLRAMGFSRSTNGIMRIFTDQLNSHISRQAQSEFYFNGHNLKVTRKESYLIRTETTINNPKSPGLQFAPGYILKTLWFQWLLKLHQKK